ncbi:hypothetical protein STSP2_01290 [Anaerohalosphaera lusitana]|uniref:Uncharacterized protein n=1 Tax=Anaerohalosphaera lusitana TaxID=1936003 RepID=A0A1U9NJZ0_9BACT|nr:hypothetical protein [Anaerohalosphaera lusitana]AQT68135.1 hypothetical protein STSP2_01290 [Anaerohalosphaera lusitana]
MHGDNVCWCGGTWRGASQRPPELGLLGSNDYEGYINENLLDGANEAEVNIFADIWDSDQVYAELYGMRGRFAAMRIEMLARGGMWERESDPNAFDVLVKLEDEVRELFLEKAHEVFALQIIKEGEEPFYGYGGNPGLSLKLAQCGFALVNERDWSGFGFVELIEGVFRHAKQLEGCGESMLGRIGRDVRMLGYDVLRKSIEEGRLSAEQSGRIARVLEDSWPSAEDVYDCVPVDWAGGLETLGWASSFGKISRKVKIFGGADYDVIRSAVDPGEVERELEAYYSAVLKVRGEQFEKGLRELRKLWNGARIPLRGKQPFPKCLFCNYAEVMGQVEDALEEHAVLSVALGVRGYYEENGRLPVNFGELGFKVDGDGKGFAKKVRFEVSDSDDCLVLLGEVERTKVSVALASGAE